MNSAAVSEKEPIAIIAGNGLLPFYVAKAARDANHPLAGLFRPEEAGAPAIFA